MSAVLAWALYPLYRAQSPLSSRYALIAVWVGALIATTGSALIIFDFTGWYLAGLYTMVGYALVGISIRVSRFSLLPNCSHASRPMTTPHKCGAEQIVWAERQVLILITKGYTNRAIADALVVAERTSEIQVSTILGKLGVTSRTQATTLDAPMCLTESVEYDVIWRGYAWHSVKPHCRQYWRRAAG